MADGPQRPKLWLAVSNPEPVRVAPSPALDDSQLFDGLRRGDPSAATALHDRVRPQVDRTVGRLLGRSDPDCEDVAQAAMVEIVYGIDRFRGDCSLDSWCSTIAAHVVYKHIRRRQTERRIFSVLDPDAPEPRSSVQAARDAAMRGTLRRIRDHLGDMDDVKAWTFVLHDVCGYDLREIAQITGVTVAAAQARLTRGRRELHERIAADPELAQAMDTWEGGES